MSSRHVNRQMLLMAVFYWAEQQEASWRWSPQVEQPIVSPSKRDTTHWQLISKCRTKVCVCPKS